jgi:hypothetical protein
MLPKRIRVEAEATVEIDHGADYFHHEFLPWRVTTVFDGTTYRPPNREVSDVEAVSLMSQAGYKPEKVGPQGVIWDDCGRVIGIPSLANVRTKATWFVKK